MLLLAFETRFQRMKVCPSSTPFAKVTKAQSFNGRRSKTNTRVQLDVVVMDIL